MCYINKKMTKLLSNIWIYIGKSSTRLVVEPVDLYQITSLDKLKRAYQEKPLEWDDSGNCSE